MWQSRPGSGSAWVDRPVVDCGGTPQPRFDHDAVAGVVVTEIGWQCIFRGIVTRQGERKDMALAALNGISTGPIQPVRGQSRDGSATLCANLRITSASQQNVAAASRRRPRRADPPVAMSSPVAAPARPNNIRHFNVQ